MVSFIREGMQTHKHCVIVAVYVVVLVIVIASIAIVFRFIVVYSLKPSAPRQTTWIGREVSDQIFQSTKRTLTPCTECTALYCIDRSRTIS